MTIETLINEALSIWISGGWAMIALAINGFILFCLGLGIMFRLRGKRYRGISDATCRQWIEQPAKAKGPIGTLIESTMTARNLHEMDVRFREFRYTEVSPFERDLRILRVCVSASPLLGLLGTVTGMLTTFHALAVGTGGQKTMDMVAGGISEALITTETGLIIALPGLLFLHHLEQNYQRYDAFLTHVETLCAQTLYRRLSAAGLARNADPSDTSKSNGRGSQAESQHSRTHLSDGRSIEVNQQPATA